MKDLLLLFLSLFPAPTYRSLVEMFVPPSVYTHAYEPLENSKRRSSFPYLTGDTFRSLAQVYIDELRLPLDPLTIKNGDIIFLKSNFLEYFFSTIHPKIQARYILVCGNSDFSCPGKFFHMLNDNKMIAWFAINPDISINHAKFFAIPIGIANRYRSSGNIEVLESSMKISEGQPKDILLYFNMNLGTKPSIRNELKKIFDDKSFCYQGMRKPWKEYLADLGRSKFVLSPHGNGLDCYRTWEALLMGSIPVVKASSLDVLYEGLPVLIVQDWNQITEDFLNNAWQEMQASTHNLERMFAPYWLDKISNIQRNFLILNA